jgi:hypothetical protein
MQQLLAQGVQWDEMLYIIFEDERLTGMKAEDLNLLLEVHLEMYGKKPILFWMRYKTFPDGKNLPVVWLKLTSGLYHGKQCQKC